MSFCLSEITFLFRLQRDNVKIKVVGGETRKDEWHAKYYYTGLSVPYTWRRGKYKQMALGRTAKVKALAINHDSFGRMNRYEWPICR